MCGEVIEVLFKVVYLLLLQVDRMFELGVMQFIGLLFILQLENEDYVLEFVIEVIVQILLFWVFVGEELFVGVEELFVVSVKGQFEEVVIIVLLSVVEIFFFKFMLVVL